MRLQDNKTARFLATSLTTGLAASAGNAATVQITLTGNNFSTTGGYHLSSDVTGDGIADIGFTGTANGTGNYNSVRVRINGDFVIAQRDSASGGSIDAKFAPGGFEINAGGATTFQIGYNPLTFTDARINGGAPTNGYLEVNAFASNSNQQITLSRVIFDDAGTTAPAGSGSLFYNTVYPEFSAVPEPSGLSLLALGAGGLLARRRRQVA